MGVSNGVSFPYARILKQAWQMTRGNVQLWVFGFFLILSVILNLLLSRIILGQRQLDMDWLARFLDSPWDKASLASAAIIVLLLSAIAKGAVIVAAKKLAEGQRISLSQALAPAEKFAGTIFWLQILLMILFLVLLSSLTVPVIYLALLGETGRALALAILGFAIFLPVGVLLVFMFLYSPVLAVLYRMRLPAALAMSFHLTQAKLKESLALGVFLAGIALLFMILLGFSIILVSAPIAFLFLVLSKIGALWAISPLIFVTAAAGLCGIVILSAGLAVFNNFVWVLAVMEMVKTEKMDEAEAKAAVPEAELA